jgi:hypothetical protein
MPRLPAKQPSENIAATKMNVWNDTEQTCWGYHSVRKGGLLYLEALSDAMIKFIKSSNHNVVANTHVPYLRKAWFGLDYVDVGQNGRPRGPQMWMSSLVFTYINHPIIGVPNFDPYPCDDYYFFQWKKRQRTPKKISFLDPQTLVQRTSSDHILW